MVRSSDSSRKKVSVLYALSAFLPGVVIMFLGALKTSSMIFVYGSDVNAVYVIIIQLVSFVTITNLGFETSFNILYNKYFEDNDINKISGLYKYSIRFFRKIATLMVLVAFIVSLIATFLLFGSYGAYKAFCLQFIVSIPPIITFYIGKDITFLSGINKGYLYILYYNIGNIMRIIISVFLIYSGFKFEFVIIIDIIINILSTIVFGLISKGIINKIIVEAPVFNEGLISLNKYVVFSKINNLIFYNTDGLIISRFLPLLIVSVYNSYVYIVNCLLSLTSYITASFTRSLSSLLFSEDNYKEITIQRIFIIVSYIGIICILPLMIGIRSFVVDIWISSEEYSISSLLVVIFVVYFIISILKSTFVMIENAKGLFKYTYKINLFESVSNIVISLACVMHFGMSGAVVGSVISMSIATVLKARRIIELEEYSVEKFILIVIKIMVIILVNIIISLFFINTNFNTLISWMTFMSVITLSSILVNGIVCYNTFVEIKSLISRGNSKWLEK